MRAEQIELLERSKRRTLSSICLTAVVILVISALRFVPRLNDALSGQPEYLRLLTETFARQFAAQTQMQFPVIVEHDERVSCRPVTAPSVPDEDIRGTIYLLTYSEQQHLTCITTYVVPPDASRFSGSRSFTPAEGKNYGPALLGAVRGVAEERIFHPYAPEYLRRLHWQYKPHFPLSPSEAENLRSQSYYSGAKPAQESVSIDLDYGELRADVAQRHRKIDVALSSMLLGGAVLFLFLLGKLWLVYRAASQYSGLFEGELTPGIFLRENVTTKLATARRQYFERQQQTHARLHQEEKLRMLRAGWQENLRSALPNLTDEQLSRRVQECLEQESQDLEQLKSLWIEVQEHTGSKTPTDRLSLLLESAKPYCTEEEFVAGQAEALEILNKSGFRAARTFAIAMHDRFRTRARELEELENKDRSVA